MICVIFCIFVLIYNYIYIHFNRCVLVLTAGISKHLYTISYMDIHGHTIEVVGRHVMLGKVQLSIIVD